MQQGYERRRRDDGWQEGRREGRREGRQADRDDDWRADRDDDRPRRRGVIARAFSLFKLALFLAPIGLFAASYLVTDCGSRSGSGIGQLFKAGACARGEILKGALSLPDDLGTLRRAMN